ncbi:High affinity cAMP-specific and IBMX-insensitive 3',5'-cyclic phosphodiesterase 8B [Cichlidogyrus casuarinus]|uniref:High affinity cAMP-specific and IBMX-insensitive 3',5'-cyclic phosphodiesterase 8B n=1 Tax=Cichlidogyrus casuarinus TaxID=1844966 RepID=A0ABD2QHV9_9PLAT
MECLVSGSMASQSVRASADYILSSRAVLESHHAALAFQLSKDEKINIFKNLPSEEFRNLRKQIIDLVLATEMARHFEHLTKFVNNLSKPMMNKLAPEEDEAAPGHASSGRPSKRSSVGSSSSGSTVDDFSPRPTLASLVQESPENRSILKRMLIKCCDVNNPTRPLEICKEWAIRIAEEYFAQTDDEKRLGLPLVMPTFDRQTCNISKSQTSFIDFFLKDMFAAWDFVCDCPEIIANLESNYKYWNELVAKDNQPAAPPKLIAS